MDGLHVVLITLMDDVFKSFKLILACQSFKKLHQNSKFTTRISILVKNYPPELRDWKTRFRKTYRSL